MLDRVNAIARRYAPLSVAASAALNLLLFVSVVTAILMQPKERRVVLSDPVYVRPIDEFKVSVNRPLPVRVAGGTLDRLSGGYIEIDGWRVTQPVEVSVGNTVEVTVPENRPIPVEADTWSPVRVRIEPSREP